MNGLALTIVIGHLPKLFCFSVDGDGLIEEASAFVTGLADCRTASAFAARSGDQIDGDKEMIAIGAANIAAGFFQGFPVSTSGSPDLAAQRAWTM